MNPVPLTRRELREDERARAFSAAAEPLNGPSFDLSGNNFRSAFATISISSPEPMTLAVDQAREVPTAASASTAVSSVAPADPKVVQAEPFVAATPPATPTEFPSRRALRLAAQRAAAEAAEAALTEAAPTEFPSRRALRLAAQKAAVESVETAPTESAPTVNVAVETVPAGTAAAEAVAVETVSAGIVGTRRGFAQKNMPAVDLPQSVASTPIEASSQSLVEDAPAAEPKARSTRSGVEAEVKSKGSVNARSTATRTAPRLAPGTASRRVAGPRKRPARSRARSILAKGFPLVAMTFVAGLMIATTTPAAALLSQADVSATSSLQAAAATAGPVSPREGGQSYTAASGDTLTVARDGYETSSVEKIAQESGIRMEATYTNNPNGTIQWPFPVGVHIGDQFGPRDCAGCSSNHRGQDFNPGDGAPIQTIADGVVRIAENGGGSLGVYMLIDHEIDGRLVSSVYAHMQYDTMKYEVGDTVKVGDVIGITGTTGMSTGPHLHFEIRLDGVTNVDPLQWLYSNTN